MRGGLSLRRLHNRDRCTGVAARSELAWKTQGVRSPLATGVCRERRRLPGLRTMRFRLSGKGDQPGSIPLRTMCFQFVREAACTIRHCGCNVSDITVDLSTSPIGDARGRIGDCVPIFFPASDHQWLVMLLPGTGHGASPLNRSTRLPLRHGGDLGSLIVESAGNACLSVAISGISLSGEKRYPESCRGGPR